MIAYQHIESKILNNTTLITKWLNNVIIEEGKEIGEIVYVFCTDDYLVEKNIQFLNHNTLTDVVAFDYCEEIVINGDVLISTERVVENAHTFEVSYLTELHRVMVHGLLHLLGYKDKNKKDAILMRNKENYYLNKLVN